MFICTVSAMAQETITNRLIDYKGFQTVVAQVGSERESRRLTEKQFIQAMAEKDVVLLDARSASKFEMRHIRGAVNLQFTDFTASALAQVIPDKNTKVLIYCNNNFERSPVSFASKAPSASLNLSTYTSLRSYGYTNVFELGPLLDVSATAIPFEGSEVSRLEQLYLSWHRECEKIRASSNTRDYIGLPSFGKIINVGKPALPFLIQKMKANQGMDFMLAFAACKICGWNEKDFIGGGEQSFKDRVLKKLEETQSDK